MEQRPIDGEKLKNEVASTFHGALGITVTGAVHEIIDWKPTIDLESLFFTIGKRADDLEKLYTKIQAVTGMTPERLLELFLEGYTLQAPDYRKNFEEMQRAAWMDLPGQDGGQDR